ncbi:hypothetical protein WH297_12850 [Ochrobactrum vermis]|uniref:Uncharacterized protein n=1 Tax=Ochrobactrum vermis TaxID=1827297 RepID=A0ABU8PED9_9HYPH|nr:hypothetical protein [Ochrobactrum vermis]PQZ30921.1 hypothetical protein CQZ93_13050 [Ochrobactrum vermis]
MDNWLKVLVATACLVIIAGGGYFAWTQYGQYQARAAYEQNAPHRHCERVYADIRRLNAYQKMVDFTVDQIKAEQANCDKLLGIKRG